MTAPWVFAPSVTQGPDGDDIVDDSLTFAKNWTYENDSPGDDGLPGPATPQASAVPRPTDRPAR
jgi:hypothetical protein